MSRIYTICEWCYGVYDQLPRHWARSRCGPRRGQDATAASQRAREAAYRLTSTAATINETELARLREQPDPLRALCQKLGTKVVPSRRVGQVSDTSKWF